MDNFTQNAADAARRLRKLFPATPLQRNAHLSQVYGADIWLKREDLSPVRSYKLRGAFNAMSKQPEKDIFVCASAGNHAQGVAFVCHHMKKKSAIFMPTTTPKQKIDKTKTFGGEFVDIHLVGDYFDDTLRASQEHCQSVGGHFLSPFDDLDVIEGQSTVIHEAITQMDKAPDVVIVPVGGGGLSASTHLYLSQAAPKTQIFFIEPKGAASLAKAIQVGKPVTLQNNVDTFVDGAAVARIGEHTFAALKDVKAENVLSVCENRICTTLIEMLNIEGIVLEPAGALAIDALKDLRDHIAGKTVLCVSSGGNFDFERLPEVKERAQQFSGLKKYFILRMPQRPGALREFLHLLGPDDDVARFEYLKKSARNFGTILLGVETTRSENFIALEQNLKKAGIDVRDITTDEVMADFLI